MTITEPLPTKDRLAIALDVDTGAEAIRIAKAVSGSINVAKIGLVLFGAEGRAIVEAVKAEGLKIFIDTKMHDIPATVEKAAKVYGGFGVDFSTFHLAGGVDMTRAAVEGLKEGAAKAGLPAPMALGVTVLTSDETATEATLTERLDTAREGGCTGVVCAAPDLAVVTAHSPGITTMVPGIRPAGGAVHDQKRVGTPASAIEAGASILVIGRAVTEAADPAEAAHNIAAEVTEAASAND